MVETPLSVSRIMTPAPAHSWIGCRLSTRATISPSPARVW